MPNTIGQRCNLARYERLEASGIHATRQYLDLAPASRLRRGDFHRQRLAGGSGIKHDDLDRGGSSIGRRDRASRGEDKTGLSVQSSVAGAVRTDAVCWVIGTAAGPSLGWPFRARVGSAPSPAATRWSAGNRAGDSGSDLVICDRSHYRGAHGLAPRREATPLPPAPP